jgi:hypothetical protein
MTTKRFDFADIDAATIAALAAIPFDRAIVTGKQVCTVRYLLDLDIRPTEELRAVRNTSSASLQTPALPCVTWTTRRTTACATP